MYCLTYFPITNILSSWTVHLNLTYRIRDHLVPRNLLSFDTSCSYNDAVHIVRVIERLGPTH